MLLTSALVENSCSTFFTAYKPICYSKDANIILVADEKDIFTINLNYLVNQPKKYILIFHATDSDFTYHHFECIKPFVKHIYAVNCKITHKLITKIPAGVAANFNPPKELRNNIKDILCYLPHLNLFINGNPYHLKASIMRQICIQFFKNKEFVTKEGSGRLELDDYYNKISRCKFVIVPMGVGSDTYKIYEAAYLGATPIIIKNGMDDLYKKFGALMLDDWDDLTEELLKSHVHYQPPDELFEIEYWLPFQLNENLPPPIRTDKI